MVGRKLLSLTSAYQLGALAIAAAACVYVWPQGTMGMVLGGLLMAANFKLMVVLAERVVKPGRGQLACGLALAVKMVVMMAAIAAVLTWFDAHALAFVAGMGTLFVGLGLAVVHMLLVAPSDWPLAGLKEGIVDEQS